jgi:hypothetical protein
MYKISEAVKNIGTYPQIQKIPPDYDRDRHDSIDFLSRYYLAFPNFDPYLPIFPLTKAAKLTDMLSCSYVFSSCGWLINDKFANLLADYCIAVPYRDYPAQVQTKDGGIVRYNYRHFLDASFSLLSEAILFDKSEIYHLGKTRIRSFNDYLRCQQIEEGSITCKKMIVHKAIFERYDLISFGRISIEWFSSDRLKRAIENAKITGVKFNESEEIFFV